jgi:hypothetical protein
VELRTPKVKIVPVEVESPLLAADQQREADIFFGRYFVTRNLSELVVSSSKPFAAADISNVIEERWHPYRQIVILWGEK